FTNAGGILQLDDSQHFQGLVAGFASPSGVTEEIDLRDIAFGNSTNERFVEALNHLSGTLKVTDGTHTANLTLLDQYSTADFSLASDGHGGTIITDGAFSPGGTPTGSVTVSSGQTHIVSSGQTESGDIVLAGGTLDVLSGGTISSTVDSGTINVYGIASATTLSGGALEVASGGSTGSAPVTFTNAGGILELDDSRHFHGLIAGFASPSGVTEEIDLRDIVFGNRTHATFNEASNHLSGTLTVTNGTQTAHLT